MYQQDNHTEAKFDSNASKIESLSLVNENDEFFDALCSPCSDTSLKSFDSDKCESCTPFPNSLAASAQKVLDAENCRGPLQTKRRSLVPLKADHCFSLWSLVKHCIGKDLTRIPLPVYFNEPLSTLQRLTEEYEYAHLLKHAADCSDSCEQLVYVSAFIISSYSSSSKRTGKPFNPLLGETFESDRSEDLGWRCISEQVSHHPPIMAQYCEGEEWEAWQEFSMTTKLKGTSLLVNPIGVNHLKFKRTGHHYTWNKVSTTVHNLVIGTLWLDHHGEIKIRNHTTGDSGVVQFHPYRCFSSDSYRKVTGIVCDKDMKEHWIMRGTWDHKIEAANVLSVEDQENLPNESFKLIWRRIPPSVEDDKFYNMTLLACQLNELEEGIAPTDSRLRPDQRLMEDGKWEDANQVKAKLEEKQRQKRHQNVVHQPVWFKTAHDELAETTMHLYTGDYWDCKAKQDWTNCPDIFL